MVKLRAIKRYNRQVIAIVEKNISLELMVKTKLIVHFINPIVQLFILIFIFGLIFNIKKGFNLGYWNSENYILFLMIAFCIQFSRSLTSTFNISFFNEKYWKTLSAIMIAPVNRFTLLIGGLVSELLMNSIPLAILLTITYILYPISIFYLLLVFLIFFSIQIIFASIGLIIAGFGISHEKQAPQIEFILKLVFLFSCINYPKEIFPEIIQIIIILNPLYYLFDLLRIVWYMGVDYNTAIRLLSPIHIIIILTLVILSPIISISLFNRVYKKYGIRGY